MKPFLPFAIVALSVSLAADIARGEPVVDRSFGPAQWLWLVDAEGKRLAAWHKNTLWEGDTVRLGKTFEIDGPIDRAVLRLATDDATARVSIVADAAPGQAESSLYGLYVESFAYPQEYDVAASLQPGRNRVTILANTGPQGANYSAVALRLDVVLRDGRTQTIVSDETWTDAGPPSVEPRTVRSFGAVAADRWTDLTPDAAVSPFDDYEQWQQAKGTAQTQATDAAKFQIADGFEIELLKSAGPDEGSWVSIACDPQGRFVIGREDKGLLRLTLPAADAAAKSIAVETINDTAAECRGLLFAHDSLYAIANTSQILYRLRDADGDDRYEQVEELFRLPGKGGHGRNGLALGPDDKVYLICGDAVDVPTDVADRTSPFTERRRGEPTKEGFVLRFDADGNNREIVCSGLRNPYGIAFNPDGEPFTYDADAEFDMGSPWYRPTRVLHLTGGADFGWRGVTGSWPPYFPDHADNAPPVLDIGKGSPTTVLFGTQSRFPPRYQRALFILDWAYGRIVAVDLEPRGSSYVGKATTFCKGRPFNVTSLCFGRDGAMYVVTGGRKTQSGLYRIRHVGSSQPVVEATPQQIARREHAAEQRQYRRKLESLLSNDAKVEFADVQPALASADPQLRYVARTVVEHQPPERRGVLRRPMKHELPAGTLPPTPNLWEQLGKLTIATRADDDQSLTVGLTIAPSLFRDEILTPSQRMTLYDLILHTIETHELSDKDREQLAIVLQPEMYRDPSPNNAPLVRALAALRAETLVDAGLKYLDAAKTQREQMLYLFVLRDLPGRWSDETRTRYFHHLASARHWQGGEGMPRFIQRITDDALASVPENERAKYAALVAPEAQAADDAPLVQTRPLVRTWRADDVPMLLRASDVKPDPARGKQMFAAALCSRCHRFGTSGHAVGPDLTGLARRFSRRDMLEHIIVPSKVIAEQYRTVQIETTDGRVVVGRILSEGDFRSQKLRIATNPLDPRQVTEVEKSTIESHTTTDTSLMPEGLLNTLDAGEIRDLLAYLETAGVER